MDEMVRGRGQAAAPGATGTGAAAWVSLAQPCGELADVHLRGGAQPQPRDGVLVVTRVAPAPHGGLGRGGVAPGDEDLVAADQRRASRHRLHHHRVRVPRQHPLHPRLLIERLLIEHRPSLSPPPEPHRKCRDEYFR
ncbi:MAG: hypothetical protein FWJ90_17960 [Actinomadura sp.]